MRYWGEKLPVEVVLRLGGAGFRVRTRTRKPVSAKWCRLRGAYSRYAWDSRLPVEWWLGGGKPLTPYIHGIILDQVREFFRPKDLKIPSWFYDDELKAELNERRLLRGWMSMWLVACKKFYTLVQNGETSLSAYLDLPLVARDLRDRNEDEIVKFGFFWKCADRIRDMPVYCDSALPEPSQCPEAVCEKTEAVRVNELTIYLPERDGHP